MKLSHGFRVLSEMWNENIFIGGFITLQRMELIATKREPLLLAKSGTPRVIDDCESLVILNRQICNGCLGMNSVKDKNAILRKRCETLRQNLTHLNNQSQLAKHRAEFAIKRSMQLHEKSTKLETILDQLPKAS